MGGKLPGWLAGCLVFNVLHFPERLGGECLETTASVWYQHQQDIVLWHMQHGLVSAACVKKDHVTTRCMAPGNDPLGGQGPNVCTKLNA